MVLAELKNHIGGKLSNCDVFDSNVVESTTLADKPWQLIPILGKPFSLRLKSKYQGRNIVVYENDTYVGGMLKGSFEIGVFSINEKLRGGFASKQVAKFSLSKLPVFSETGNLSAEQKLLLSKPELETLVRGAKLQQGESFYFTNGEIGFYLKHPNVDCLVGIIDQMVNLAQKVEVRPYSLDLKKLPADFHRLIPLIQKWAIADDSDRDDLISCTPTGSLQELVNQVQPYFKQIDSYLDLYGKESLTEEATALGRLAEVALEAKHQLELEH